MATAFNFYQPQDVEAMKAKKQALGQQYQSLGQQKQAVESAWKPAGGNTQNSLFMGLGNRGNDPYHNVVGGRKAMDLGNQMNAVTAQANAIGDADVAEATNRMYGMTAGVSDQMMNDPRVTAALDQIQAGMKSGPYSPEVQQQMVNRQADQTAAAEAANAEQIRSDAAAMGTDPRAALRRGQAQRQQSNIAFQGDIGSKAAVANYGAQQDAARNLAATRLGQYGQAQQGYGQAANYAAQTQFSKGRKAFTY